MSDTLRVFIGYDPRQPVAYNVLAHSVWSRASKPVSIVRLQLSCLPIKRRGLTEFTYSRFLVPYLSEYEGHSVFLDSDMLCLGDIHELYALACVNELKQSTVESAEKPLSVHVVKNARRFEWPSMMVFKNDACRVLTPAFIDSDSSNLYDLAWAANVGELHRDWNQIVGYDAPNPNAKLIHYTQGIPCWPETKDCEFSDQWRAELRKSIASVSFSELMGNSVHAKPVAERLAKAPA